MGLAAALATAAHAQAQDGEGCVTNEECASGYCDDTTDPNQPTCAPDPAGGMGTDPCSDGEFQCDDGSCVPAEGDCVPPTAKVDGEPCVADDECASGYCDETQDPNQPTCAPDPAGGMGTDPCSDGEFQCDDGSCVPAEGDCVP